MPQPLWATNADKFARAVAWVTEQQKAGVMEINEETVKERYIALGGLVAADKQVPNSAPADALLDDLTVPQLKQRAAASNIDISGITAKADIIVAIREVEEAD